MATAVSAPPLAQEVYDLAADQEQTMKTWFSEMGFPEGLAKIMVDAHNACPLRYFIVDNSGSMSIQDGNITVNGKQRRCSRWEELKETIMFHGRAAAGTHARIDFRLLNPPAGAPQMFTVGTNVPGSIEASNDLNVLAQAMNTSPAGGTPLCMHIRAVAQQIQQYSQQMAASGHRAVVVIATDGKCSDGDLGAALKTLERLPVNIVVRMCTDEDDVVDYYSDVDKNLEISVDVLDDLKGEAKEIRRVNPWFVYSDAIHKAREFGIHHKLFDLIDERAFSSSEVHAFCNFVFGCSLPHPEEDYKSFEMQLLKVVQTAGKVTNPINGRREPWINMSKLRSCVGKGKCAIM